MRAIIIESFGEKPKLAEISKREGGPTDLQVRLRASSVNGFDLSVVSGSVKEWMPYELPVTLGRDFAGVVEAVGAGVTRYEPGDEVYGCFFPPTLHDGSWAEYLVTPEDMFVAPKPRALSFVEAGALGLAGVAALKAVEAVDPRHGEVVLVIGATGGVGGYSVQLAHARGAHVIATSVPLDDGRLRSMGADRTIDFTSTDIVAFVRDQGWAQPVCVIDTVSTAATMSELAALVPDGSRIATTPGSADVEGLAKRGIAATNVWATTEPELLERLARHADDGDIKPSIERVYPLDKALDAVTNFRAGSHGKIGISIAE